jgi:membrane protein
MIEIFKNALSSWIRSRPMTHSAAAAYFAVFSLPGLLIIVISITTFFLDENLVRSQIQIYVGNFIGASVADSVLEIIDNARLKSSGFFTIILGSAILLFGATGLFNQLKASFNSVWKIETKSENTIMHALFNRMVSLGVAVMIGFLLLMSMYLSALLKLFGNWLVTEFPDLGFVKILELGATFLTISLLFTLIFKVLPDIYIKLRHAFSGGVLCALLFLLGEWGFARALDSFFPQSVFGAAGSIVLIMIWVTYGCMILQFGAEFIRSVMKQGDSEVRTTRFVKSYEL